MKKQKISQPDHTFTLTFADGQQDQDFSIDAPDGEFLGECGLGVSKTFGTDQKVLAFEAWMFDKEDIQTVIVELVHSSLDASSREQLAAKGRIVEVEVGKKFRLETETMIAIGYIRDFDFNEGHFDSLIVDLKIWRKPLDLGYEDLSSTCVTDLVDQCPMECVIAHGFWIAPSWLPLIGDQIFMTIAKSGKLEVHETGSGWIFFHPGLPKGSVRAYALQYDTSFHNLHHIGLYLAKKVSIEEGVS